MWAKLSRLTIQVLSEYNSSRNILKGIELDVWLGDCLDEGNVDRVVFWFVQVGDE